MALFSPSPMDSPMHEADHVMLDVVGPLQTAGRQECKPREAEQRVSPDLIDLDSPPRSSTPPQLDKNGAPIDFSSPAALPFNPPTAPKAGRLIRYFPSESNAPDATAPEVVSYPDYWPPKNERVLDIVAQMADLDVRRDGGRRYGGGGRGGHYNNRKRRREGRQALAG